MFFNLKGKRPPDGGHDSTTKKTPPCVRSGDVVWCFECKEREKSGYRATRTDCILPVVRLRR